jgi:hypothetical protein
MTRPEKDAEREERIDMEVIVDAYGPEERATGWYTYLSDNLHFPFRARCRVRRTTSPLEPGEDVKVLAMASDEESKHEMFVMVQWQRRRLAVPLMQLEGLRVDEKVRQAMEDWQYWVERGYEF